MVILIPGNLDQSQGPARCAESGAQNERKKVPQWECVLLLTAKRYFVPVLTLFVIKRFVVAKKQFRGPEMNGHDTLLDAGLNPFPFPGKGGNGDRNINRFRTLLHIVLHCKSEMETMPLNCLRDGMDEINLPDELA